MTSAQLLLPLIAAQPASPPISVAFRSGMSRSKDFWGAADAGAAIGVVAGELSLGMVLTGIPRFLRDGGYLFVDSGAFAELRDGVAPDFDRVLTIYERLAEAGDCYGYDLTRLYVVSPDKVGDQLATLDRIAIYKTRICALIEAGCNVIVPIQRGTMPAAETLERVAATLATRAFVAGIPSNKEAMSIGECATLRHSAYHILARVQMNQDQVMRIRALAGDDPAAAPRITADANWLRSRLHTICQINDIERQARAKSTAAHRFERGPARTAAVTKAIQADPAWPN